jgi:N-methylhydantoinase A
MFGNSSNNLQLGDRDDNTLNQRINAAANVEQVDAATFVLPRMTATVDPYLNLTLELP